MRNKNFNTALTLLSLIILFAFIFQVSGCDKTKGSNLPSSPSGNTLTLSASPDSIAANGTAISTITAKVTGQVSGVVVFTTDFGTLSATEALVDSSGNAEVTITNDADGTARITAFAGELSSSVFVTFGSSLTLSASNTTVLANDSDVATLTATLGDAKTGTEVTFTTSLGTLSSTTATSDASGLAQVTLKSGTVGTATATAIDGNNTASVRVTFIATNSLFIDTITSATAAGTPSEVDVVQGTCGTTTLTAEPFFDEEATAGFSSIGSSQVNITDYTITYTARDGGPSIPTYIADVALTISPGGSGSMTVTLIKAGSVGQSGTKLWYAIQSGASGAYFTYDALYNFTGTDLAGNSVSVSGSLEIKLGNYDNC